MPEYEPLKTDPRSYESPDGDILPLDLFDDEPLTADPSEYMYRRVHPEEVEGPYDRIIQKALAEQALSRAATETAVQPETLTAQQALSLLYHTQGFYPHDNDEKNMMIAVLGRSEKPLPLASYFSEIQAFRGKTFDKQHAAQDEHEQHETAPADLEKERTEYQLKALRHIVHDMTHYADAEIAAKDASFARLLNAELTRRNVKGNETFEYAFTEAEIRQNPELARGLTSLVRRTETDRFVENGGKSPLGKNDGIDSVEISERPKRIFAVLKEIPLEEMHQENQALVDEERKRFDYWRSMLEQATFHNGVASQAHEALKRLNKLRPRTKSPANADF